MQDQNQTITLFRDKECKGSVRFNVPESEADNAPITNVYVSRSVPGIQTARSVEVTLTVN